MKRHTVYLEESVEPYLAFDEHTGDLLAYQEKMLHYVLPSQNEAFLRHIQAACVFLDTIYSLIYERACREASYGQGGTASRLSLLMNVESEVEEREVILQTLRLDQVCEVFFRWHTDFVQRGETMTGLYAVNYFLSWGCCVRAFHLVVYRDEEKLQAYAEIRAREHRYCQMVSRRENVFITDAPLIEYSISDLWNSMRIFLQSLYTYSYCKPMRSYVYALFFRYGDLLSAQQQEGEHVELDDIYDNPLFVTFHSTPQPVSLDAEEDDETLLSEAFDAYKQLGIVANEHYTIHNEFLYQGEALFYYQLRRIQLSDDLIRYHAQPGKAIRVLYPSHAKRIEWLKFATEQWCAMCVQISTDTCLRKHLIEQYTETRVDMHLYHGERERYRRQFPSATCDARAILQNIRPLAMTMVNATQHHVLRDIVVAFKNDYLDAIQQQFGTVDSVEFEKEALERGLDSWCTFTFEQEALLLTKLSTALFFDSQAVPELRAMEAAFILEELVPLQSVEEAVFLKRKSTAWPIFLKLVRLYYVVDPVSNHVFKSLFFVEAYFVWLSLCKHRGLLKKETSLHPELLAPLKKLNTMLQF